MPWVALALAGVIIFFIRPIGEIAARQFERMFGASRESGAGWARAAYLSFAALLILYAIAELA
ncbi:MAG: hypothetical protein ACRDJI_02340 [Actinomycetota bacterium]